MTIRFIKIKQMENHVDVMQGDAGDPWQYRLLSDYLAEALLRFVTWIGYPRPGISAFVLFRFLQNLLIFCLAALYYRKLGLNHYLTLLGMSILAWGMTHALYDSDLSFNLYTDIAFYLIAGILILKRKYVWTIPLVVLAAFNRETSGLIPFMLLAAYLVERPPGYKLRPVIAIVVVGIIFLCNHIFRSTLVLWSQGADHCVWLSTQLWIVPFQHRSLGNLDAANPYIGDHSNHGCGDNAALAGYPERLFLGGDSNMVCHSLYRRNSCREPAGPGTPGAGVYPRGIIWDTWVVG